MGWLKSREVIKTKYVSLQGTNQILGRRILGEAVTYPSASKVESDESGEERPQYHVKMLNTLTA